MLLCPWNFPGEILEWVASSYSRGSSWPRNWICVSFVSCIASGFFTAEPPWKPQKVACACVLSHFSSVWLSATPLIADHQALLARILERVAMPCRGMGFSRQEYWSGLPCPPPGDLPDPEMKLESLLFPALAAGSLPLLSLGKPKRWLTLF